MVHSSPMTYEGIAMATKLRSILSCLLIMAPLNLMAAETMYVQSYKAYIYEKSSFSSRIVDEAKKGDKVNALAKRKNWLLIESGSKRGWVLGHTLSKRPPVEKVSFFDSFLGLFKSGSIKGRKRASVAYTTVGVRGLTDEEKRGMDQDEVAAYEAVDKMDELQIQEAELARFIEAR